MDIAKLITKKTGEDHQIERFEKASLSIKTKKELRILEMHLLKPKPVPVYKGDKAGRTAFQKCSLMVLFPDKSYVERLSKFFTINTYVENNIYDIDFLIELINLMEKKRIKWNKLQKKFFMKSKTGKKIKL